MSTAAPILIESSDLSHAWGELFLYTMSGAKQRLSPVVLTIGDFTPPLPPEDDSIRRALDGTLEGLGKNTSDVSAVTIFPYKMWIRRDRPGCRDFSALCVERLLPRMKSRDRRNSNGTYFERLMSYKGLKRGSARTVNQLDFVINLLRNPIRRPRHSALQLACFDPAKDHTGQPVRGFPCLQQVSISYDDQGGLALTGYYPTQYIFDRAYGNYLGLCQLGAFIAHEASLQFSRMTCFVGHPELGKTTKGELRALESLVRRRLPQQARGS